MEKKGFLSFCRSMIVRTRQHHNQRKRWGQQLGGATCRLSCCLTLSFVPTPLSDTWILEYLDTWILGHWDTGYSQYTTSATSWTTTSHLPYNYCTGYYCEDTLLPWRYKKPDDIRWIRELTTIMPPLFISILGYPWSTTLATPWILTSHLLTTTAPAYYVLLLPWTSKILITLWKLDDNQDWKWLQQIANRQNHNQDNEHNHHPHQHHHHQSPPSSHSSLLLHSAIPPLLTSSMLFPLSYHNICCDYLFSTLSAIAWYQETTFRPPQFPPSAAIALPPHGSIYSSNSSLLATSVLVLLLVPPVTTLVYPLAAAALLSSAPPSTSPATDSAAAITRTTSSLHCWPSPDT